MKNRISIWILNMAALVLLSSGVLAQEKAEVTIRIKKDGKVIKDTTYQFEDAADAENALDMMEVLSGDEPHHGKFHYNYTMSQVEGDQARTMVFISEDGEHTTITEIEGDSLVWIKEDDQGEKDGKKMVRVTVTEGDEGTWTVREEDDDTIHEDGEATKVIVIKKRVDGDQDIDLDEDHDEDHDVEVNVKVIKKKQIEEDSL